MRFEFADDRLEDLYYNTNARSKLPPEAIRGFRKKMQLIAAAVDERDIYNVGGARLEKLSGDREGQFSVRLNKQWRLILQFRKDEEGNIVVILDIVDYH
ncbi:MAG: type II toxin-antitoxin system RelE/ParE family toxin [Thermomicrobiales bacterium]|nr:type II toxin-antitoxin system RelE/ParE family toxin [Thermomicrobiales bacterium]MCO5218856.1 type II toxin-antitoxin system RelE/ParE family toxin [Thermomicrobiales bacterium]MCO5225705.1 type II toxin-antitoxin system RelE/ParE family toxin [Thermomicrobiales bacterium]MCO5227944.1 type II toxin-antitoxin system RelE/ParE family toxin [Thermomicrobiales bacterium]